MDQDSQDYSLKEDRIGNFVYYGNFTFRDFVKFYVRTSLEIANDSEGYLAAQIFYNEMIKRISRRFGLCQQAAMESYAPLHLYFNRNGEVNSSPLAYVYPPFSGLYPNTRVGLLRVRQADGLNGANLEDLTDKVILDKGIEINSALSMALRTQASENLRGKTQPAPCKQITPFEEWLEATRISKFPQRSELSYPYYFDDETDSAKHSPVTFDKLMS